MKSLDEAPFINFFDPEFQANPAVMIDAVRNRHVLGVDNIMWSSDYPHHGCDWPETRRVVDDMFRDVPLEERRKMCAANAAKLYHLV